MAPLNNSYPKIDFLLLLNSFFEILTINDSSDSIQVQIEINPGHDIFNGHFPGNPVTPGVVQIQMVKEVLESYLGRGLKLKKMPTCKFLKILNPIETPKVDLFVKYGSEEGRIQVQASGKSGDITFFKFIASYE